MNHDVATSPAPHSTAVQNAASSNGNDARRLFCAGCGTATLTLATILLACNFGAANALISVDLLADWGLWALALQIAGDIVLVHCYGRPAAWRGWTWLIVCNAWLLVVVALYQAGAILFALTLLADLLLRVVVAALWSVALFGLPYTLFWIWRHRRPPRPEFRFGRWWFSTCLVLLAGEPLMAVFDRDVERLHFPAALADSPTDELRIAFIGDSVMFGYPYDGKFGIPQVLTWRLQKMYPQRRVVAENLAIPGQNLQQATETLAQLKFKPHLLVVYCGHAEYYHECGELFGTNTTYFGALDGVLRRSPTFRLLNLRLRQNTILHELKAGDQRGFVDLPIASPELEERRRLRFRSQLEQLARYGSSQGIGMLWYVPAASESGYDPNRSCVRPWTSRQEINELYDIGQSAADRELAGDWNSAADLYRTGLRSQPQFADFHFRLGACLEKLDRLDDARRHFQEALEVDGHPIRATHAYRTAIVEVGAGFSIPVVLTDAALRPHTAGGILDRSMFFDNTHATLRGFFYMGLAGAKALVESRLLEPQFGPPAEIADAEFADALQAMNIGRDDVALALRRCANGLRWLSRLRFDRQGRLARADEYVRLAERLESGEIEPGEEGTEGLR